MLKAVTFQAPGRALRCVFCVRTPESPDFHFLSGTFASRLSQTNDLLADGPGNVGKQIKTFSTTPMPKALKLGKENGEYRTAQLKKQSLRAFGFWLRP